MSETGERTLGPHPGPGDVVGGYRLGAPVGMGGTSCVFRATDARGQPVAVKVLDPARVLPEDVRRFTREYHALSRMDHPNVVAVYQAGVYAGYPWIAMELVDGTDLGTLIERWRDDAPPDRFERAERILRGLCRGLQYVHDLGLIHRDLKPGNVLVTRGGEPKLTDFGVVKADASSTTHHTQLTMAGRLVGTVAFMAPELITEEGVDRRADLYALGAVLYVVLTGRRPIEAKSVAGYLARHLTEVPRPAGELDPAVPRRLERIAQRLLIKDKAYRYPTAAAVLQALDRRESEEPPPLRGRDGELSRWGRLLAALVDGAGAIVAIVAPAGGGKTRLLEALLDQIPATDGADVLVLRATGGRPDEGLLRQLVGVDDEVALTERIRGRRVVLAVDDLDRADAAEIVGLARVARERLTIEADPLLVVFTTSPTASSELAPALRRRARASDLELEALLRGESTDLSCEILELGPIDVKSAIAMMRDRGVSGPAAPLLGRRLHADYAGRPAAIVQQLDALREAGWFEAVGDALKPRRTLEAFRREDLPVHAEVEAELEAALGRLDAPSRLIVELLAAIDGPAPAALLERCAPNTPAVPRLLDRLVQDEILASCVAPRGELEARTEPPSDRARDDRPTEHQEVLRFAHPCAARVVRRRLAPEVRRLRHQAIADALATWRRRASALDIAHHRELAGDPAAAYPLYVAAARRAARRGAHGEVLDITTRAEAIRPAVEGRLPRSELVQHQRALDLLEGEAMLGRGSWAAAAPPLERALAAARLEQDTPTAARCLAGLGRAEHRRHRFVEAAPLLAEALSLYDPGSPDSLPAVRALADIRLREGDLAESERLWKRALELAIASPPSGSGAPPRDAEARARRGLAHLRAVEGRLQDCADLLDTAEELLPADPPGCGGSTARVRAGIVARSIEIDTAAGRYGGALRRAEALVELVRRRELSERLADTYALLGEALVAVGDPQEAEDAAQQALVFARAHGPQTWAAKIRAARVLCTVGRPEDALAALPSPEDVPQHKIDDPAAQLAALRARLVDGNPTHARDLATWAMTREPPLMALRAAHIALDASIALASAGQATSARNAVKRGLKALQGPGADGVRLELLLSMQRAAPDDRVLVAAGQVAQRIAQGLSPQLARTFSARPPVREALDRVEAP